MPERSHAASDLDTRLAEIDNTLRSIQAELIPDHASRAEQHPQPEPPAVEPAEHRSTGRHGPLESLLERAAREPRRRRGDREPPQPSGAGPPVSAEWPVTPEPPLAELAGLTAAHIELLATSQQLLDAYLVVLDKLRTAEQAAGPPQATVHVGPFATLGAVRAFEAALATLPGVLEVRVRGYESGNRAIIEVQLSQPPG